MNLGIKLLSRMTCLRVGMPETEYSDILSFRRQVYMAPAESPIPDSTTVSFEDTTYRIFLAVDGPSCTLCKQPRHTLDKCSNRSHPSKERTIEDEADITTDIPITTIPNAGTTTTQHDTTTIQQETTIPQQDTTITEMIMLTTQETRSQTAKRQISTSPEVKESEPTLTETPTKKK
nr:unnamed protein product [Callosobruchus analis]